MLVPPTVVPQVMLKSTLGLLRVTGKIALGRQKIEMGKEMLLLLFGCVVKGDGWKKGLL